jgi:peptide deformylase
MVRHILVPPAPALRMKSEAVEDFSDPGLRDLIDDMIDTLDASPGVGLAAPQIGATRRAIVFRFAGGPRAPGAAPIPLTVLLNPVIRPLSESVAEDWEGCLSLPGTKGRVRRWDRISYEAQAPDGSGLGGVATGFHARIIQHEVDHLDGVLYHDRCEYLEMLPR